MLDAPISGGPAGAQKGVLTAMVGGDPQTFAQMQPLLELFAKTITHVGPLGAGHAVKAINNIMNAGQLLLASEGLVALAKLGIDPKVALDTINASSGRSLATQSRLPEEVLTRRFGYGFKLGLMRKDVANANNLLDDVYPQAVLMRATRQLCNEAVRVYGFNADYTELARLIERAAGTQLVSARVPVADSAAGGPADGHHATPDQRPLQSKL